jgi:hypothetical protein
MRVVTGPVGIFGTLINGRRVVYNTQKLNIIEARMERQGWETTQLRKRDVAKAVGPSAAASQLVAPGVEHLGSHFAGHAVGHGAGAFTAHHASDLASATMHHPVDVISGVAEGVKAQGEGLLHACGTHHLVPIEALRTSPGSLGFIAGQAGATAVQIKTAEHLAEHVFEHHADKKLDKMSELLPVIPEFKEKYPVILSVVPIEEDEDKASTPPVAQRRRLAQISAAVTSQKAKPHVSTATPSEGQLSNRAARSKQKQEGRRQRREAEELRRRAITSYGPKHGHELNLRGYLVITFCSIMFILVLVRFGIS